MYISSTDKADNMSMYSLFRYAVGHSYNSSDRINSLANIAYSGVNQWFDVYERRDALQKKGMVASMLIIYALYPIISTLSFDNLQRFLMRNSGDTKYLMIYS